LDAALLSTENILNQHKLNFLVIVIDMVGLDHKKLRNFRMIRKNMDHPSGEIKPRKIGGINVKVLRSTK
jgi:hypothetical protein